MGPSTLALLRSDLPIGHVSGKRRKVLGAGLRMFRAVHRARYVRSLGRVHGRVRVAKEHRGVCAVFRIQRTPYAGSQVEPPPIDLERHTQRLDDLPRHEGGAGIVGCGQQDLNDRGTASDVEDDLSFETVLCRLGLEHVVGDRLDLDAALV